MRKTMLRLGLSLIVAVLMSSSAKAWNCSDPLAERVIVPASTPGQSGDADGQLATFNGKLYECEVVTPTPPTTPSQNQSQTQRQTANANSSSSAKATGGSATNTLALRNVGNSSNTNTNTATGGQGGSARSIATGGNQSQSSTSSASNNGNGANNSNYESNTVVHAAASSAFAVAAPTAPCIIGTGAGIQTLAAGANLSFGRKDHTCQDLEIARSLDLHGSAEGYCTAISHDKEAQKLGITFEICMRTRAVVTPPVGFNNGQMYSVIPPVVEMPPVSVQMEIPTVEVHSQGTLHYIGDCKLFQFNSCIAFMQQAIAMIEADQSARVLVYGPLDSHRVLSYLYGRLERGQVNPQLSDDQNSTVTFEVWSAE